MTEAELSQLLFMAIEASSGNFTTFLTITFGYLATAYLVGHRLTAPQAHAISALFVIGSILGMLAIFGPYQRAVDFAAQLETLHPGWTFMANQGLLYAGTTLIPLSVVVSLYFMYHVRRNPRFGWNERESRTLAALRDSMLHRLISGELRVKDAERYAAKVT